MLYITAVIQLVEANITYYMEGLLMRWSCMRLNNGINKLRKHVMTMYILMKRNLREILLMLKLDSNFIYKFSLFEMLKCGFLLSYVTLCHAMLRYVMPCYVIL